MSSLSKNVALRVPVISANMRNITGSKMAIEMVKCGGLGILHRFNTICEAVAEYREASMVQPISVGVSIGVKDEDKMRFVALYDAGARIFCIDVAHGDHVYVKYMLEWLNLFFSNSKEQRDKTTLIAGNVATAQGAGHLVEWGADVVKVGIGGGSVCETRRNTGVGVPQFSALQDIDALREQEGYEFSIISDGGIVHIGDVAKAMIFADAVMVGSLIAGTSETPGKVFRDEDDQFYKVYGGSASGENKESTGQAPQFVEGIMKSVPFKGHVKHILREIHQGLQSAFSYSGAKNLQEFQAKVKWNEISSGSKVESKI
jgi:IMP dehydrogenase